MHSNTVQANRRVASAVQPRRRRCVAQPAPSRAPASVQAVDERSTLPPPALRGEQPLAAGRGRIESTGPSVTAPDAAQGTAIQAAHLLPADDASLASPVEPLHVPSLLHSHAVACPDILSSCESEPEAAPLHARTAGPASSGPAAAPGSHAARTAQRLHAIKVPVGSQARKAMGSSVQPAGMKRRAPLRATSHNHPGGQPAEMAPAGPARATASAHRQALAMKRMHKPAASAAAPEREGSTSASKRQPSHHRSSSSRTQGWTSFLLLVSLLVLAPAAVQWYRRTASMLASSQLPGTSGRAQQAQLAFSGAAFRAPAPSKWQQHWGAGAAARGGRLQAAASTGPAEGPAGAHPHVMERRWSPEARVRVVGVVPEGAASPYQATWDKVMAHTSKRLAWNDPSFQLLLFTEQELAAPGIAGEMAWHEFQSLMAQGCQLLLGGALSSRALANKLSAAAAVGQLPRLRVFLGAPQQPSPPELLQLTSLQGYAAQAPSSMDQALSALLPWSSAAKSAAVWGTVKELWGRHTSDDLLFVFLLLINQYITPVKEVAETTKGFDLDSLRCMLQHCRQQIVNCVRDTRCKAGLDCLQGCSFNDQVCQYRCIVSYETPEFSEFSLCVIQKHNCRSLNAQPPRMPDPAPMTTFQGAPLTHELAEAMLLGWMQPDLTVEGADAPLPFSWLVAAGKNPAYDFFPCQHQLFYRGKGKGVLWYEPVFKALTLDGQQVWRRRRYRVKRGTTPGTFYFSVLDNGVTSNEFWRVVDCDDAYQWCLFYYSGAASAAGLSYSGAVLGTRDGSYPTSPQVLSRLEAALDRAGIQPWELSFVDNTQCAGAPLELSDAVAA